MLDPVFLIRSPELVRQIAIKDFEHFTNRKRFFVDTKNSLFGNSIFQLEDQKWKDMRSSLSPAFTGSKMRAMFELIRDVGEDTVKYLKESKQTVLNLRDFLSRYANDVIATTAFGFQINSNKDRDNEFYKMGEKVTDVDFHDLFRPDMINLLMEIRGEGVQGQNDKKASHHWNDMEIVAQSFIFFFAAFDTVSATLSFLSQELLENQDCQDRLREEILEIADSLDGEPLSYEALGKMKYADAVIAEAMRKWPAIPFIDRVCKKTLVLQDPDTGKDVTIKKGDFIQMFTVGIQRDPRYFPDPMKFDPERFSEDNKKSIEAGTVFPFGIEPRMCIGNRFALLEMKSLLFHLFKNYKFEKHEKSVIPLLKLDPATSKLEPAGGFWVKLTEI